MFFTGLVLYQACFLYKINNLDTKKYNRKF